MSNALHSPAENIFSNSLALQNGSGTEAVSPGERFTRPKYCKCCHTLIGYLDDENQNLQRLRARKYCDTCRVFFAKISNENRQHRYRAGHKYIENLQLEKICTLINQNQMLREENRLLYELVAKLRSEVEGSK